MDSGELMKQTDYVIVLLNKLDHNNKVKIMRKCRFGPNCRNIGTCRFNHSPNHSQSSIPCRFGLNCWKIQKCRFYHPNQNLYISEPQRIQIHSSTIPNHQENRQTQLDSIFNEKIDLSQQNTHCHQPQIKPFEQSKLPQNLDLQNAHHSLYKTQQQTQLTDQKTNQADHIFVYQQNYLWETLEYFFNLRLINTTQFTKIYNYLDQKMSDRLENIPYLLSLVQNLENEPELISNFGYFQLIKTIVIKNLQYKAICEKLRKQISVKQKKIDKTEQLLNSFPNLIQYKFLDEGQLLNLYEDKSKNVEFVIDGNNILPSHKIFRKYFQSRWVQHTIEGQIRLRWLISQVKKCTLFYDELYVQKGFSLLQNYWKICHNIMEQQEVQNVKDQQCHFTRQQNIDDQDCEENSGDEWEPSEERQVSNRLRQKGLQNLDKYIEADDLIEQYVQRKLENKKKENKIILITGDRVLIQRCLHLGYEPGVNMEISSGKQFISMCKEVIRRKYFDNKVKKKIIKRIFIQPRSLDSESEEEKEQQN